MPEVIQMLEKNIRERTSHRVWNLRVEMANDRVIVHGNSQTFHAKQLATQGVREVLPETLLTNAITVA